MDRRKLICQKIDNKFYPWAMLLIFIGLVGLAYGLYNWFLMGLGILDCATYEAQLGYLGRCSFAGLGMVWGLWFAVLFVVLFFLCDLFLAVLRLRGFFNVSFFKRVRYVLQAHERGGL